MKWADIRIGRNLTAFTVNISRDPRATITCLSLPMSLQGCLSTNSLVFMSKRPVADDQNARNEPQVKEHQGVYRNALVFFSARVLSHCGFLLSLFAIWLTWLMPTGILQQPAAPEIKKLKSRAKPPRRPTLSISPPEALAPVLATDVAGSQTARRVYFADAPQDMPIVEQLAVSSAPIPVAVLLQSANSQTKEASPQLSAIPTMLSSNNAADSLDSLVLDSDSSSRPSSLKRSARLARFKLGFRSSSLDVSATQGSVSSDEAASSPFGITTFLLKGQRTSLPVAKPVKRSPTRFSFRRCSLPTERVQVSRTPKPIPRTMPYGPPYFATPPIILDDNYSAYSNTRPQLKDELNNSRTPESDSELSRGRRIRRVPLSSTTNTRSMSGDFTNLNQ